MMNPIRRKLFFAALVIGYFLLIKTDMKHWSAIIFIWVPVGVLLLCQVAQYYRQQKRSERPADHG